MQLHEVDARDEHAFAEWFGVVDEAQRHDRGGERSHTLQERREVALGGRAADDGTPPAEERVELLVARQDGAAVGAALLELPLSDNTHSAFLDVHVLPGARRRGIGWAVLAEVVQRAQAAGRGVLMADVDEPPGAERCSPGRALLERAGFDEALVEVRRDLALPVDPARLDAVEAASLPHAGGYAVRTWRSRCPDDLVEQRAELGRQMSLDVPLGELAWEEEAWDAARVRRREHLVLRQGRTMLGGGAVDPTGAVVAFTEVVVADDLPEHVHQWETFVLAEHRGHRLGTLVKVAVLRRLTDELPDARVLSTSNAATNGPMVAVNDALGFRPNGLLVSFQRRLGP